MGDQYGSFHDQELVWNTPGICFWETIDGICRATGNRIRPHYDTRQPGLVVVTGARLVFRWLTPDRFEPRSTAPARVP